MVDFFGIDIISLFIFIFPAYIANSSPLILGGGKPLDLGKKWKDGERVFGDGKTIRGFIGGISAGIVTSGLLAAFAPISDFNTQFYSGVLLSIGTLVGDALGSFVKRRFKIKRGSPFFLDQLGFLIIALIFAYPLAPKWVFFLPSLTILLVVTYFLHIITNKIANIVGLKRVPW